MENIMLQGDKKQFIKIVDFGLGNVYDDVNLLKTQCGSPEYAAPELFIKGRKYGPEVDLWSLGVIMYVMVIGRLPFLSPQDDRTSLAERRHRLRLQISQGLAGLQERALLGVSAEYRDLVHRLLTPAAPRRITMLELCAHPCILERHANVVQPETDSNLDNEMRETIVNHLVGFTNIDPRKIQEHITNQRFGNIAGMYNIISHEIQRNGLDHYNLKKRNLKTIRTSTRNLDRLQLCKNTFRDKQIQSLKANCMENQNISKNKRNNSFSVTEYDRQSQKVAHPFSNQNKIPMREAKNFYKNNIKTEVKIFNESKTSERPMTLSDPKRTLPRLQNLKHATLRPLSELRKKSLQEQSIIKSANQSIRLPRRLLTDVSWKSPAEQPIAATKPNIENATKFRSMSSQLKTTRISNSAKTHKTRDQATESRISAHARIGSSGYYLYKPRSLLKNLNQVRASLEKNVI